ncbi:MAG TPA: ATP-binding protein [Humisphaera sp.]
MLTFVLSYHLDLAAFAAVVLACSGGVHLYLRRATGSAGLNGRAWLILVLVLGLGCGLAVAAGEHERDRLREQVEGFAPTYALEMERAGHAALPAAPPPDDPKYLAMIEMEKRWQAVNPAVNDIYTFRATPGGGIALLVDSETDYDRNGKFEGDREQRTAPGEPITGDLAKWNSTLAGHKEFDGVPYTDRWGTWVSAYVPLRDSNGNVEGGLGVDFDATQWNQSILARRVGVLSFAAVAVLILVWSGRVISLAGAEIRRRHAVEQSLRASEGRLRAIVDNEPEAVLVVAADGTVREVNPSGVAALELGDRPAAGMSLASFAPPESAAAVSAWVAGVAAGRPGRMTLPVRGLRGTDRWLDAHAVPLPAGDGAEGGGGKAPTVLVVARDVTAQRAVEAERERLQAQLVDASRQAGMAEVANGVLHNVGNVLNTVTVGTGIVTDRLRRSRAPNLTKAVAMLDEHRDDLAAFLTADERGRQLPAYLRKLAETIQAEQEQSLAEMRNVSDGVEHIKAIVAAQQSHAGRRTVDEPVRPAALFEDAVKMNIASCERHAVRVDRAFEDLPAVLLDRHKVIQVLVNLISNAKNAVKASDAAEKRLGIRVRRGGPPDRPTVRFEVEDNGHGIAPDVMPKLFGMGFTTRKDGHGFGLHAAANLAKEMGGSLTAQSDGPGRGATFVLEVPARPEAARDPSPPPAATATAAAARLEATGRAA